MARLQGGILDLTDVPLAMAAHRACETGYKNIAVVLALLDQAVPAELLSKLEGTPAAEAKAVADMAPQRYTPLTT